MKLFTALTTPQKFENWVTKIQNLDPQAVTVFVHHATFQADPQARALITQKIAQARAAEADAVATRDYQKAQGHQNEAQALEQSLQNLAAQANKAFREQLNRIGLDKVAVVTLGPADWNPTLPFTTENFTQQIPSLSQKLTTTGINGKRQPTPLTHRAFIPMEAAETGWAAASNDIHTVLESNGLDDAPPTSPPGSVPAATPEAELAALKHLMEATDQPPATLSPNQKTFAETFLAQQHRIRNIQDLANLTGLSLQVTKSTRTQVCNRWPRFRTLTEHLFTATPTPEEEEATQPA